MGWNDCWINFDRVIYTPTAAGWVNDQISPRLRFHLPSEQESVGRLFFHKNRSYREAHGEPGTKKRSDDVSLTSIASVSYILLSLRERRKREGPIEKERDRLERGWCADVTATHLAAPLPRWPVLFSLCPMAVKETGDERKTKQRKVKLLHVPPLCYLFVCFLSHAFCVGLLCLDEMMRGLQFCTKQPPTSTFLMIELESLMGGKSRVATTLKRL
jgi:hypothetical protein